jgi:hypothetical protein
MAKGEPITATTRASYRRITKVRRVESAQRMFFIAGASCVQVVGE